jgi:hypothetical protein
MATAGPSVLAHPLPCQVRVLRAVEKVYGGQTYVVIAPLGRRESTSPAAHHGGGRQRGGQDMCGPGCLAASSLELFSKSLRIGGLDTRRPGEQRFCDSWLSNKVDHVSTNPVGIRQTELALGDQLGKVGKTVTSYKIAMALADHMVHRSAKVDTDKFQDAPSGIFAMWCISQGPFESGTFQSHLVAAQTSALMLAQGGVNAWMRSAL